MSDPSQTEVTDFLVKSLRGDAEVEFSMDPDGDMYIHLTGRREVPQGIYISAVNARKLRDWLGKVVK